MKGEPCVVLAALKKNFCLNRFVSCAGLWKMMKMIEEEGFGACL